MFRNRKQELKVGIIIHLDNVDDRMPEEKEFYIKSRRQEMKKTLTNAEMKILEILWNSDGRMSGNDILASGEINGWSSGYLHNVVRSMLAKGAICVTGMVQNKTQYARMFGPKISREEYAATLALSVLKPTDMEILKVTFEMAKRGGNTEVQEEIGKLCSKFEMK